MRVFPYYGSKTRIGGLYQSPTHDTIIEPFAGAAAYSQRYWEKNVVLCDADRLVFDAWTFVIAASAKDVLSLPDVKYQDDLSTFAQLSDGERALMQLHAYDGLDCTGRRIGKRCIWNRNKPKIASIVHRFNHWRVFHRTYTALPDIGATWFIDPPYQFGGEHYHCSNKTLDFAALASWCRSRQGQVIVCENTKADWLPFTPLVEIQGIKHRTTEAVWYRQA